MARGNYPGGILRFVRFARPGLGRTAGLIMALGLLRGALFPGCAVIEKDNRHLTKAVREILVPEDTTMKVATSPVWVPAGIVTLAADGLVLNPVFKAPDALDDSLKWSFMGFGAIWPTEIVLIVPRAVAVPVIFVGSEVLRCSIPYVFKKAVNPLQRRAFRRTGALPLQERGRQRPIRIRSPDCHRNAGTKASGQDYLAVNGMWTGQAGSDPSFFQKSS